LNEPLVNILYVHL